MSINKDDSGMSYQQLGFSPSAFLNTSENSSDVTLTSSKEMFTSTPAKGLKTTPKTPSILITPLVDEMKFESSFNRSSNSGVNKRKTIFDTSLTRKSNKKKAFVSTTPRTPTPLRSSKKDGGLSVCTETKLATIDEISKILMKKADTTSTPDHDYATKLINGELNSAIAADTSLSELTTAGGSNAGNSKTSLRRTLFETPGQNASMVRPLGVNLFTEKELNAIEQMSTCFTPQKEKEHDTSSSEDSNENDGVQQQQQQHIESMTSITNNARIEIPTRLGGAGGLGAINEKGGFSFILNPNSHQLPQQQHKMGKLTLFQQQQQQQQQPTTASVIGLNQISGRPEIRILPLVGKPMKVPIRRLPPRNLNFSSDNNVTANNINRAKQLNGDGAKMMKSLAIPTQADAFRAVAFGQSHDQKFLTEQARLIMKEIHQASLI